MGNKVAKRKRQNSVSLTEEEIDFLLANTHYNREEIVEWHEGFIKDCPDGRLDKEKFIDIYAQFYQNGKANKFCGFVFNTFDVDSSGSIDFREFLIGMSASAEGDLREKLQTAFRIYDIDKNGLVDKKEMEQIINAIYELRGEDNRKGDNAPSEIVKRIMNRLDKNNDGAISLDEFITGCETDEYVREYFSI